MSFQVGGGGGGSGGFLLGPATNTFDTNAARNIYATANADWYYYD